MSASCSLALVFVSDLTAAPFNLETNKNFTSYYRELYKNLYKISEPYLKVNERELGFLHRYALACAALNCLSHIEH